MRLLRVVRGSVVLVGLLLNEAAWADAFVNFFYRQKVGQEITVTGGFRRFSYQKQFFRRDYKSGEVEYFEYFGMTMVPTKIIGNGSLSLRASVLDAMVFLYPDQELVKDLPEQGENLWFTGTLIGFQYGTSGIISSALSGGDPYILLKRISTQPPQETTPPQNQTPGP
ncbi:MAG: hypothetical protein E6J80_07390 [Deltaproteobacteria bacterium]|nr:MAG: hypothetical protein E6J80_07390 [Deltaproteobacteria bacterium]